MVAVTAAMWLTVGGRGQDPERLRIESVTPATEVPPRPFLVDHRIVSFYGNPLAPVLGALGEQSPEQTIARLRAQADAYVQTGDDRIVVPALHLIYAVAQETPGEDGMNLLRMDDALVDQYVRLARENDMLLFLDIQLGRSTVEAELPRIFRYLQQERVHVGLDPEFAWGRDGVPGEDIGRLDASQINRAQEMLQRFARAPTPHQNPRGSSVPAQHDHEQTSSGYL